MLHVYFLFTFFHLLFQEREGIFIGSENELRSVLEKSYFRDKMMDVILISEPFSKAMHHNHFVPQYSPNPCAKASCSTSFINCMHAEGYMFRPTLQN